MRLASARAAACLPLAMADDEGRAGGHIARGQDRDAGLPDGLAGFKRRGFAAGEARGEQQQIAGQLLAAFPQGHGADRAVRAAAEAVDLRLIAPDIRAEDGLRLLVRMVALFRTCGARLADELRETAAALPQGDGYAVRRAVARADEHDVLPGRRDGRFRLRQERLRRGAQVVERVEYPARLCKRQRPRLLRAAA